MPPSAPYGGTSPSRRAIAYGLDLRRPERSRLKGGAVEGPFLGGLATEKRSFDCASLRSGRRGIVICDCPTLAGRWRGAPEGVGGSVYGPAFRFFRRRSPLQRSEQVLTSSQTRAHFRRQSNGRPQAAQVFCGRLALVYFFAVTGPPGRRPRCRRSAVARRSRTCRRCAPSAPSGGCGRSGRDAGR